MGFGNRRLWWSARWMGLLLVLTLNVGGCGEAESDEEKKIRNATASGNFEQVRQEVDSAQPDQAARHISTMGQTARQAHQDVAPQLRQYMADNRPEVRIAAIDQYAAQSSEAQDIAPVAECMADADADVRATAARALGDMAPYQGTAFLLEGLADPDHFVRECALAGLERKLGVRLSSYDPARPTKAAIQKIRKLVELSEGAYANYLKRRQQK